jgi:PqqD family protein of HPr-rel-A system
MSLTVRQGRPVRKPEVWLRTAGDENAAYNPTTGSVYLLNETALAIWDLCDGQTSPEEMVTAVVELTGMHPDVVTEDVERILKEFEDAGLLSWED